MNTADAVIAAVGVRGNGFCAEGVTTPVYLVGDCAGSKMAGIANAIRTACHTANSL